MLFQNTEDLGMAIYSTKIMGTFINCILECSNCSCLASLPATHSKPYECYHENGYEHGYGIKDIYDSTLLKNPGHKYGFLYPFHNMEFLILDFKLFVSLKNKVFLQSIIFFL